MNPAEYRSKQNTDSTVPGLTEKLRSLEDILWRFFDQELDL